MTGRLRTRELPVFPVTAEPARPREGPQVTPVEHSIATVGSSDGPKIALITLGCDKNTVDSEKMIAALVGHGAQVSSEVDGADLIIINTCGFIEAAKEESVEAILEAGVLKEQGRVRAVVAVGCMVERYRNELEAEIPEVDLFLGLTEMDRLIPELRDRSVLPRPLALVPNMQLPVRILSTDTPHTSYLKISEGCDHTCAFCAIPHMRGLHRSAPIHELVQEAQELESHGVKELNIISQDTTWYGKDFRRSAVLAAGPGGTPESTPLLPDLLRALIDGTTIPWVRLFYMYPSGITPELVQLLASQPRLLPYLDMPIQHGSDSMLKRMRRPERQGSIRDKVHWLRSVIPDLVLRTTVIVGFPGETEVEFQDMLDFLKDVRFERVGAFPYSLEEDTPAAAMRGHLSELEKRDRLEALMDVQREISFERNEELVGRRETLLVDRTVDDDRERLAEGRIRGQAAEFDGLTQVTGGGTLAPGTFAEVQITDTLDHDLIAGLAS